MSREKQIEEMAWDLCDIPMHPSIHSCKECGGKHCHAQYYAERAYNAGYRKMPENIGEFSDGYHTFNELYHHRAVLFSVICNMFPEKAWKSRLHDTGDMYDGMFIVGIETEQGQATYHYDIEPYWDIFKVKELEKAPKYDGHTPSDAIARIGNIKQSEWISVEERLPTVEEQGRGLVGIVNGYNGKKRFTDARVLLNYDYNYNEWYSEDYDIQNCKIECWMPLPEAPKMKGGAE